MAPAFIWIPYLIFLLLLGFAGVAGAFVQVFHWLGYEITLAWPRRVSRFGGEEILSPVSPARFERICDRLIEGDLFDTVRVSHYKWTLGSVLLEMDDGYVRVSLDFSREPHLAAAFQSSMVARGYDSIPLSKGANGLPLFVHRVRPRPEEVARLVADMLELRQEVPRGTFFVGLAKREPRRGPIRFQIRHPRRLLDRIP